MAWRIEHLNDRILRMMRPADRRLFGKAGLTTEEAIRRAVIASERDLQRQIENLLRLRDIVPIRARMDKKTTTPVGTPDIFFAAVAYGGAGFSMAACAWECKLPGKDLSPDQRTMREEMVRPPNAWHYAIIHHVDDALAELRGLGIP